MCRYKQIEAQLLQLNYVVLNSEQVNKLASVKY